MAGARHIVRHGNLVRSPCGRRRCLHSRGLYSVTAALNARPWMSESENTAWAPADAARAARVDLAACHRLAARFGFSEGIDNHMTLLVPGRRDRFLLAPFG